ncbi:hypothetical protein FBU59_003251 [Linderina macrospora]|uniref:Uncharacterized protein n=1 Tax=Linderina macrospora TaxID=4868 RepID=A0ACC1J901_9FUNG|nr:hypothetical protein FBU59_003251 [Linderina macrospora]
MADADEDMDLTTIPTSSFMSAQSATSEGEPVVRYYHPDTRSCPKQISLARYMIDITDVEQIVPYNQEDTDADEADDSTTSRQASESPSRHSMDSRLRCKLGDRQKGKKLGFLRSKHARQAACKFKIVTRAGSSVVLWTSSEECMHEWVKRLTDLRDYWLHRRLADALVRSQVCTLNYPIQGHRSRERDMIDWNDEQAWADRAIWHACLSLGCRDIIMAGVLYRKRHRHQGMRRVFCILTRGRLIEYSYPKSYSVGTQSLFSDRIKTDNPSRADLFGDALPTTRILAENARDHPGNIDDDDGDMQTRSSKERLLFAKSRSLSLRRCYVLSRFVDDLSTNDIMCEPWVMTDISNYSGLRLADRIYADGIVSHELVQDCIFTLWRPIFIPRILRSNKKNTVTIPEVLESTESEMSSDDEIQQLLQQSSASSSPSHHGRKSVDAVSSPSNNVPQKPTRMSADMLRRSGETSRKSSEASRRSADSARKSVKPVDTTKPGAYRVGDNIMVNVDDRHDGIKRMGAIGMVSSMRRRIGVYKARTSAEMEQWVMAINQEISRLIADDEW